MVYSHEFTKPWPSRPQNLINKYADTFLIYRTTGTHHKNLNLNNHHHLFHYSSSQVTREATPHKMYSPLQGKMLIVQPVSSRFYDNLPVWELHCKPNSLWRAVLFLPHYASLRLLTILWPTERPIHNMQRIIWERLKKPHIQVKCPWSQVRSGRYTKFHIYTCTYLISFFTWCLSSFTKIYIWLHKDTQNIYTY